LPLVALFLLGILNVIAQQPSTIDSLNDKLSSVEGAARYDVLIQLVRVHSENNQNDAALRYCRSAKEIALQGGDSAKIVSSSRIEGQLLNRLDRVKEASEVLLTVLPIARRNKYDRDYKQILNNLALAYTFQAKYDEALKIHFETLVLREADGDKLEISISLNNIGLVYFKLKNYDKALEYYLKALATRVESGDNEDLDRLKINIGLCYNQVRNYKEAKKYFDEGFQACLDQCSPQIEIEGNFGLGVAYYGEEDFDQAIIYFNKSLTIARAIQNKRFQAENLVYLSHIYVRQQKYEDAIKTLSECEATSKLGRYNEILISTYKEFSNVYQLRNEYQKASAYQQKYIHLKDSVYSERLIENIARVQTNYAERENIKTIASKETVIQQQRDLNVAIAVIAILAGLLILVLQRSNRISKQVNAQLSEAKATIQDQNKLLEIKNKDLDREVEKKTIDLERVNLSLKQVNDELDNFIYKTSHDIRGPLASLKGMCNVALLDVKDPIALDYLKKLDATAERLNSILTRLLIINQINNSKLSVSRIDFARIVEDVLMLEKKRGLPAKLTIRKNIDLGVQMFSDRELVRIVLENLIDNAIKFYNDSDRVDSFVDISIIPEGISSVKVRVVDNGIGISESNPGKLFQMFFRASERSEIGGIGLYIVKTATAKIGGKVGLLTTPEGYTEFYVVLPLNPPTVNEEWPDKPHL
jgi:signal transduction histidine kinase